LFKRNENTPDLLKDSHLPFGGKLKPENRWIQLAKLIIPWDQAEAKYVNAFESINIGLYDTPGINSELKIIANILRLTQAHKCVKLICKDSKSNHVQYIKRIC
jgi:hypothetical protein